MSTLRRLWKWLKGPPPVDPSVAKFLALDYAEHLRRQAFEGGAWLNLPEAPDQDRYLAPFYTLNPAAQEYEWQRWHRELRRYTPVDKVNLP